MLQLLYTFSVNDLIENGTKSPIFFLFESPAPHSRDHLRNKYVQGQLLEGVECHIYLYCFTFDDINLNRAFVIIVLFPNKYSNKKVCANDKEKRNALGIY